MKFSTAAKLTQARYGNIIQPATGDDRKNAAVVAEPQEHSLSKSPSVTLPRVAFYKRKGGFW